MGEIAEDHLKTTDKRPAIKDIIANINVDDFDITPYTDQNIIRPLPKQEEFLLSHHKATITFYGGKHNCYLSQ